MELALPKTIKEVQSLNGKVAALNRLISRAMDKCLPFFCTLRKSFEWTTECQQAFEDLKAYLSSPPLLSLSKPGEELFLYLAISSAAVSAALVRKRIGCRSPYTSQAEHFEEWKRSTPDGKARFRVSNCSAKAQAVFLGTHCGRPDG